MCITQCTDINVVFYFTKKNLNYTVLFEIIELYFYIGTGLNFLINYVSFSIFFLDKINIYT
jgi:hypothetical protein